MISTVFLAQFLGIFSIIMSLSMLLKRQMVVQILHEVLGDRGLTYVVGLIELAAGLILVLNHNIWGDTLSSFITILGWLLLIEGVIYTFASRQFIRKIIIAIHSTKLYYIFASLYLILGIILAYAGFLS